MPFRIAAGDSYTAVAFTRVTRLEGGAGHCTSWQFKVSSVLYMSGSAQHDINISVMDETFWRTIDVKA